jgi:hypothetical protein
MHMGKLITFVKTEIRPYDHPESLACRTPARTMKHQKERTAQEWTVLQEHTPIYLPLDRAAPLLSVQKAINVPVLEFAFTGTNEV